MVNMEVMGMLTGTRRSRRPAIPRVMAGITAAVLMSVPAPGPSAAGPHAGAPKLAVAADPTATARVVKSFGRLLPGFEVNRGQVDAQVKFLTRGSGYTLFLTPSEAVLVLRAPDAMPAAGQALVSTAEVRMHLAGATAQPRVAGVEKLPGIVNYFLGNDPAQWHADIPTYAEVVYQGVYPGIDLIHHGTQGRLEYDFVVGPGAEPGAIRVEFQGADGIVVDAHGDLVLHTAVGDLRQRKPAIYQDVNGVRRAIAGDYVVLGPRRVGFQVAAYDRSRPLIIDPVLLYSTYLGGSGFEVCYDVAIDATGNAYVAGSTTLTDFPTTTGAVQTASGGSADAIVAKVDPTGSGLIYSTYLGGAAADEGYGIAVDGAGNAYVTGYTSSTNFPTTAGAFRTSFSGNIDAFVTKVNANGSTLAYSTYLGGSGYERAPGIAVDAAGNAYVTGFTDSANFPTTPGAIQTNFAGTTDVFVTKVNPSGSGLAYSTYLGGTAADVGYDIVTDAAGNAYVTGYTNSTNFPTTTTAFQTASSGSLDVFAAKVNPGGSGLVYSTYLGGGAAEEGYGIAVDGAGNAYVTGYTSSPDFPTTPGAFQAAFHNSANPDAAYDAFVTKLNPMGSGLVYSTYLGGGVVDVGYEVAIDADGNAYVTGYTASSNFPTTTGAFQTVQSGYADAFVTKVNPGGTGLLYSTFLGGGNNDLGYGIAVNAAGHILVAGRTASTNFPTTAGALQTGSDGPGDAFIAKFSSPATVPGQIEAEDFDQGGEGVAYHDLTPGNQGGQYRPAEDVDIIRYPNGAYVVNNFQTGEWLQYTIQVAQTGTYRLDLLVSRRWDLTSRWHAEIDNQPVTGSVVVPDTGSWDTFWWVGVGGITLTAGPHVLRIVADQEYFNFAALRILPAESPFAGTPAAVPGQIEAEDFDHGGEGVAYHDLTPGNQGGQYRPDVDVDISRYSNGAYVVNNFQTGEWLQYTIQVPQAGTYRLELLVSRRWDVASRVHVDVDTQPVTSSVVVPDTGSWDVFWWVGLGSISLTAGTHVLRITADQEYFNVAAFRLLGP